MADFKGGFFCFFFCLHSVYPYLLNYLPNLEYVRQFAEPGAFGEQQRRRALAGHVVQVQLEPDGAHFWDGRADVLQAETRSHT